jgi:hypothetical protein
MVLDVAMFGGGGGWKEASVSQRIFTAAKHFALEVGSILVHTYRNVAPWNLSHKFFVLFDRILVLVRVCL